MQQVLSTHVINKAGFTRATVDYRVLSVGSGSSSGISCWQRRPSAVGESGHEKAQRDARLLIPQSANYGHKVR